MKEIYFSTHVFAQQDFSLIIVDSRGCSLILQHVFSFFELQHIFESDVLQHDFLSLQLGSFDWVRESQHFFVTGAQHEGLHVNKLRDFCKNNANNNNGNWIWEKYSENQLNPEVGMGGMLFICTNTAANITIARANDAYCDIFQQPRANSSHPMSCMRAAMYHIIIAITPNHSPQKTLKTAPPVISILSTHHINLLVPAVINMIPATTRTKLGWHIAGLHRREGMFSFI